MIRLICLGVCIVLLSLLAGIVGGCQPEFLPGTYTDDMGREVRIDEVPQRIVSHVPAITETLFALDLGEKVVGVSDYCNYPPEAELKDKVGNYFNPSIEKIVAFNPDLVLTDGHSQNITQLDSLGINYIVLQPKDINGILGDIELLGKVAGIEKRAERLVKDMKECISNVTAQVRDARRVSVFYLFDATDLNNPWTAGPGSFVDSLITMAGGVNVAAEAPGSWVQFSIEQVVASDPEVIMIDASHGSAVILPEELREHPIWGGMTAVKQGRIFTIDGDLVNRDGPRIVQGLEEVAKIIHPELFE